MSNLTLIVAGAPGLASALDETKRFNNVYAVASTGELRDLIAKGVLKKLEEEIVFLFADNLTVDTPKTPLTALLQKLTVKWKVLIIEMTPNARDLVQQYPAAALLPGPFSVNMTLGAMTGMGVKNLEAVPSGHTEIDATKVASTKTTKAASAEGGWSSVPSLTPPVDRNEGASKLAKVTEAAWSSAPAKAPIEQNLWDMPAENSSSALHDWAAPEGPPVFPSQLDSPAKRSLRPGAEPAPANDWDSAWETPTGDAWQEAPSNSWSDTGGWGEEVEDNFSSAGPVARGEYGAVAQKTRRKGWVITIAAPKGGTGKSSLTLNLAAYLGLKLRSQGKTVCVIDTNFQQADASKYLNVYNPNITNIVRDQTAISTERISNYLIHRHDLNISALLGPSTLIDANPVFINAGLYCTILEVLRELYDYILIDTPVAEKYHDLFANFALPQADYIVVPVAPNVPTLMNADSWLRIITSPRHAGGDGVDDKKIGVVLNRAKDGIDCSEEEVRENLQSWRFIGSIPETDAWQRANNNAELVAPQNYQELNEAFSHVLYAATGEQVLLENINSLPKQGENAINKFLKRFKKG